MKRIKFFTVLAFASLGLAAFLFFDNELAASTVYTFSGGPPPSHTGAPGGYVHCLPRSQYADRPVPDHRAA